MLHLAWTNIIFIRIARECTTLKLQHNSLNNLHFKSTNEQKKINGVKLQNELYKNGMTSNRDVTFGITDASLNVK